MLWYIRKFKDAYLVLVLGKLIENLLIIMKLKTLQNNTQLNPSAYQPTVEPLPHYSIGLVL